MPLPFLDQQAVVDRLFYPRREPKPSGNDERVVSVAVAPDVRVYGRLYKAMPDAPLLLFFHGNGEIASDYDALAGLFTAMGVSLLVMDYRGYGLSEGEPSGSTLLRDAVTVFDALPEALAEKCQPSQIFVMGRSLGSVAALELAHKRGDKLAGVIIESGFAFTGPLLARLGVPLNQYDEERDGVGNGEKIARYIGPTLILHGQADALITADQATALYEKSEAPAKHLVIVPNANHNNLMIVGAHVYFGALGAFIATRRNES